jgi:UDP-N-acetylmuramate dehydrogenase
MFAFFSYIYIMRIRRGCKLKKTGFSCKGCDLLYKKLRKICKTKTNVSLKDYCSIRIGGIGKYVCFVNTIRQTKKLLEFLTKNKIKYFVLGNGSNTVFEDCGFGGVIISTRRLNRLYNKGGFVTAFAGVNLFSLNNFCAKKMLSGLEFSYGIPASVGGALVMNAGAYGGEMQQVVDSALILRGGKVKRLSKKDMDLRYRQSIFLQTKDIILKVVFKLIKGDECSIRQKQQEIFRQRIASQPYQTLNSGSVFKRAGDGAGKIIDKMGLKGVTIGDIQISPKHANFFVNLKNATSQNLHDAIELAKQKAFAELGIKLEQEIIFVGD